MAAQPAGDASGIDSTAFRRICGLFVTGVTVITTGLGASPDGTTVNSFTSVSLEPPLVLFCLHLQSRLHEPLAAAGGFGVNFLAGRQVPVARSFSSRKKAGLGNVHFQRSEDGIPILREALAYLVCRTVNRVDAGDHAVIIGEVIELGAPMLGREPLVFFGGSFRALDQESHLYPVWDG